MTFGKIRLIIIHENNSQPLPITPLIRQARIPPKKGDRIGDHTINLQHVKTVNDTSNSPCSMISITITFHETMSAIQII